MGIQEKKTYAVLEGNALLDGQRVRLGNDGDDVNNLSQLFEDNDIDGLQSMFCFVQ